MGVSMHSGDKAFKKIFKYPFEVTDYQTITMPKEAEILCVQVQNGVPCIWALVDTLSMPVDRYFSVYGTGHPVYNDASEYIGTFQINDGSLVFHLFEYTATE